MTSKLTDQGGSSSRESCGTREGVVHMGKGTWSYSILGWSLWLTSGRTVGTTREEISFTTGGEGCSLAWSNSIELDDTTNGLGGWWGPQVLEEIICIGVMVEVEGLLGGDNWGNTPKRDEILKKPTPTLSYLWGISPTSGNEVPIVASWVDGT